MRLALISLALLFIVYLTAWPTGLEPQVWTPAPARELRAENAAAETVADGAAVSTLFSDSRGVLLAGLNDGRFLRVHDGAVLTARAPARPQSCRTLSPTRLLCVIAGAGAMMVGDETPLPLPNLPRTLGDLAVAADGALYFSQADVMRDTWAAFVAHANDGRVLRYDDLKSSVSVVADGLSVPDGLALAADGSSLLVSESAEYRVTRLWLTGDKAGTRETFIEQLPGFPAGLRANPRGGFWLALYAPRLAALDAWAAHPFLRELMFRLPRGLQARPEPRSWALELDGDGRLQRRLSLQGNYRSVLEHEGALYLSGPLENGVRRVPLARAVSPEVVGALRCNTRARPWALPRPCEPSPA